MVLGNTDKPIRQVTSGLEVLVERNEKGVGPATPVMSGCWVAASLEGVSPGLVSNLSDHEHLSLLMADRAERSRRKAVLSRGSCPLFWGVGASLGRTFCGAHLRDASSLHCRSEAGTPGTQNLPALGMNDFFLGNIAL